MSNRAKLIMEMALKESQTLAPISMPSSSGVKENINSGFDSDYSDIDKTFIPDSDCSSDESDNIPLMNKKKMIDLDKQPAHIDDVQKEQLEMDTNIQANTTQEQIQKKKWSRSVRKERTKNIHTGKSYINVNGKKVEGRKMKPLKQCRTKCYINLNEDVRSSIFSEYWSLGSRSKRVNFISRCITSKDKLTTRKRNPASNKIRVVTYEYSFEINGKKVIVCKDCFCKTLDEKEKFIKCVLNNKSLTVSGVTSEDKRGISTTPNKKSEADINEVKLHINSFPAYESHYIRRTNDKKYLPSHLNLRIMYDLYKEGRNNPVSRTIYEREFHKMKLAFKKPYVDTCFKCDTLRMQMKVAADMEKEDDRQIAENLLNNHQDETNLAYEQKKMDKISAKNDNTKACFSFDLQQCLPTPYLGTSIVFYKRQLWTYNLTIDDNATGESTNYMWHEALAGRGANEIASCLYQHLKKLPSTVKEVTFYSDTCGGQNKNSHVAAMFLKAIWDLPNISEINHKFLVPGHTHMECDVDHSLIEKQKKKISVPIYHPHDWYQLVRSTGQKKKFAVHEMTQCQFYDFAGLLKNSLVVRKKAESGESFKWHSVQWLRYCKDPGIIKYKYSLNIEEDFQTLSFLRRGRNAPLSSISLSRRYEELVPISKEKKDDLLFMLRLIPEIFHLFYQNLPSINKSDTDPDLIDVEID